MGCQANKVATKHDFSQSEVSAWLQQCYSQAITLLGKLCYSIAQLAQHSLPSIVCLAQLAYLTSQPSSQALPDHQLVCSVSCFYVQSVFILIQITPCMIKSIAKLQSQSNQSNLEKLIIQLIQAPSILLSFLI